MFPEPVRYADVFDGGVMLYGTGGYPIGHISKPKLDAVIIAAFNVAAVAKMDPAAQEKLLLGVAESLCFAIQQAGLNSVINQHADTMIKDL
jgi:hypothetical protein